MKIYSYRSALAGAACILYSGLASAQSAQAHSVQLSALATSIRFNASNAGGVGFEGQFRFNQARVSERGVLSIGIGVQATHHTFTGSNMSIAGAFMEPRFAFAGSSNKFFPYLSARLAMLRLSSPAMKSTSGGAAGGGAGLTYVVTKRMNLDIGAALLVQTYSETTVAGSNLRYVFNPFLGYVARMGLSIGL